MQVTPHASKKHQKKALAAPSKVLTVKPPSVKREAPNGVTLSKLKPVSKWKYVVRYQGIPIQVLKLITVLWLLLDFNSYFMPLRLCLQECVRITASVNLFIKAYSLCLNVYKPTLHVPNILLVLCLCHLVLAEDAYFVTNHQVQESKLQTTSRLQLHFILLLLNSDDDVNICYF